MKQTVTTVNEDNEGIFMQTINDYLDEGYTVSSSSCGYFGIGEFQPKPYWMAILVWEDKK